MIVMPLAVIGCAADSVRTPPAQMSANELGRYCEARMYTERSVHMRSPPNWNIYDRCIRDKGAG